MSSAHPVEERCLAGRCLDDPPNGASLLIQGGICGRLQLGLPPIVVVEVNELPQTPSAPVSPQGCPWQWSYFISMRPPHSMALRSRGRAYGRVLVNTACRPGGETVLALVSLTLLLLLSAGLICCLGRKYSADYMDHTVIGHDVRLQHLDIVD